MPLNLFAKRTKEELFWKWFQANQSDIYHFEKDQELIFNKLSIALGKVHPDLTFEFSPIFENSRREFIISAGGILSAFPAVEQLYEVAPKLKNWDFVKFRQRRDPLLDLEFGEKKFKFKDIHYAISEDDDPEKVGIMIFIEGYDEGERSFWANVGYLFLDEALGEYDVEKHVGAIDFLNRESEYFEYSRPISELPDHFDKKIGRKQ